MPTVIRFDQAEYWPSEQAQPAQVLDHLPEPLAWFDSDRQLGVCNQSFRQHFPVIIESEFVRRLEQAPRIGEKGEACPRGDLATAHPCLTAGTPRVRQTPDGGTLVTFHDASPFEEREAEYQETIAGLRRELAGAIRAKRRAHVTARARKDVLVSTSHELRTPLNAILGFSEILSSEMFGPLGHDRYKEYARIIHDSGAHLLSLINDLLDMSRLEAGKLELHVEPVEILKVIVDCVRTVETQAAKSRIGISIRVHDGVNQLLGDDKRLHQMLLNLLSNAIKFTPERGEIYVDVFRRAEFIAISVSDTGIGIRQEDIAKVLEPFGQVDGELARKHVGTGLGLPLTKELAELHGGHLTMESAVGDGTTITLLLPEQAQDKKAA